VWFGVSCREKDDEEVALRLNKLAQDYFAGDWEIEDLLVGGIYNCWIEDYVGWGVEVATKPHLVGRVEDILPTGTEANRYSAAALTALREIIPDEADAIFQKMELHITADYA
jgi:hypothetical protein